jgi:hypothetical protein
MSSFSKGLTQIKPDHVIRWVIKPLPWVFPGISLFLYGFQTRFYHYCVKRILTAGSLPLALIEIIRIFLEQIEWFFWIAASCIIMRIIIGMTVNLITKQKDDF